MKIFISYLILIIFMFNHPAEASFFEELLRGLPVSGQKSRDNDTIAGIKEALSIGTSNAINYVSKKDGYFKNEAIKILLPENIQNLANIIGKIGYQREVDEFVLSMNRAAEKAAPKAKDILIGAIREMTIEDALRILNGGDTAATEYFKSKTFDKLYESFKPVISRSMNEVGTTKAYKNITDKYLSVIPFSGIESFNLDHYVTTKALDGLFYMIAQEEKKIRTDPAARITTLLRKVFGEK